MNSDHVKKGMQQAEFMEEFGKLEERVVLQAFQILP